jgi:N-acetylmuramoyl-L-alanine amidase
MHWTKAGLLPFSPGLLIASLALALALPAVAQSPPPAIKQAPPVQPDQPAPVQNLPPSTAPAVVEKPQPAAPSPVQLRFVVVLDPGHGGDDTGAKLGAGTLEKDVVLSISTRLRDLLGSKGISVISTRNEDTSPSADERAAIGNHARAAACISLHATATGAGVHLFTSSLSPSTSRAQFIPWNEAQATVSAQSARLASDVSTALGDEKLPVLLGRTALRPLNSFTCPAIAVELAPLNAATGAASLADSAYQQRVAQALATALVAWRVDWRQRP